jgi:hypothetical protein
VETRCLSGRCSRSGPLPPASARYLRPVSVRLTLLGATPARLSRPSRLQLSASSFLVASFLFVPVRTAGVSRYLPPDRRLQTLPSPLLLSLSTPTATSFRTYNCLHEGLQPLCNTSEGGFEPFASLLAQLDPIYLPRSAGHRHDLYPGTALQNIHSTAKGRVRATRRDATFVAAKPDQRPQTTYRPLIAFPSIQLHSNPPDPFIVNLSFQLLLPNASGLHDNTVAHPPTSSLCPCVSVLPRTRTATPGSTAPHQPSPA